MNKISFVSEKEDKLKNIILYYCTGVNSFEVTQALKKKDIKVNGSRVRENIDIKINDNVTIFVEDKKYYDILYEDNNILIINKLISIETNSSECNKQTLLTELQKKYPTVKPVHRLDTNTLGLMCFVLSEVAEKEITNAFKLGNVIKKYKAVVNSNAVKDYDILKNQLIKVDGRTKIQVCPPKNNESDAVLEYELLSKQDDLAEILVTLHTGKTHQIRAQLSYHNIFVLGDGKYGDKYLNRKYKKDQQQLKSVYLKFTQLQILNYLTEKEFRIY